ncbi:MAG TPA: hypothetical protein VED59_02385, partial [Acidimicrobiales bacterium]|nr:hypothetical protein [Acidimicrobiales bacterium]
RTAHPWEGTTEIEVTRCSSPGRWNLSVRSPEWAHRQGTRLTLNGNPVESSWEGSYITVGRHWGPGDCLRVSSPVPVRVLRPHSRVDAVRECAAIQRGPLVYCVEADDLEEGIAVEDIALDTSCTLRPVKDAPSDLEGHVRCAIVAAGERVDGSVGQLYDDEGAVRPGNEPLVLTLVPYFARGNRAGVAMRVWLPAPRGQTAVRQTELV